MSTEACRTGIGSVVSASGIIRATRYFKLDAFLFFIISNANDWVVSPFGGLSGQDAVRDTILILLLRITALITAILLYFISCGS